ncbi:MAG: hypothetical protein AB7T06_39515 [Kofleriaceae bacterium]
MGAAVKLATSFADVEAEIRRIRARDEEIAMRGNRRRMLALKTARGRRGFHRRAGTAVSVVSPPVLGGGTYAGTSPTVTAPTYSDAGAPDSYSLRVNGVEVASGSAAAIEAYVYALADEGYTAVLRAIRSGVADSDSNPVAIDLAAWLNARATAASITALLNNHVRRAAIDLSLVGSAAETWINHGTGGSGTQATGTARPTFSATAIGGKPGLTFDGGDYFVTPAIDSGVATAYAMIARFADAATAAAFIAEYGDLGADRTLTLNTNAGSAGTLDIYADGTAGGGATASRARSAASFAMGTPAVVTGTWDSALSTNETEIRHAGVNVTSTRPNNANSAGGLGSQSVIIGARKGPANHFVGAMNVLVILAHTGSWSGAQLTALAEIEAAIAGAYA